MLDNWDTAVTGPLATTREVIPFDKAVVGRSRTATELGLDLLAAQRPW